MLAECLLGCAQYNDAALAVVCNTDKEVDAARCYALSGMFRGSHRYREIRMAFVAEKIGYVRAVNLAWFLCDAKSDDYIAVINDDLQVTGDFVTPMKAVLGAGKKALQASASIRSVGCNGFGGNGNERYVYAEGWCWMAMAHNIRWAAQSRCPAAIYDPVFAIPGYGCEDCDLSIRLVLACGNDPREAIVQVDNLPVRHLHTRTVRNHETGWAQNREILVKRWNLAAA
jgi:GT2 family glycosyltransferase